MNDKLKFYRSTLVQIAKGLIGYTPMHKLAEDADKVAKEIMKKVNEFEVSMEQHFNLDEKRVNYYFGGDNCVAKDFTCTDPNFFKGVNPDYLKTEPIRTIVDHGPQYQPNQKPYGTLGEHWKELMMLFDFKNKHDPYYEDAFNDVIKRYPMNTNSDWNELKIVDFDEAITICKIADSLGIEFIEDFVKACEKCEE